MTLPLFPRSFVPPGHTCHARDCGAEVKPELLMCLRHWRMVPRPIQRAVWAAYRPGQCDDKRPNRAWMTAADAAIAFVARAESKPVGPDGLDAIRSFGVVVR